MGTPQPPAGATIFMLCINITWFQDDHQTLCSTNIIDNVIDIWLADPDPETGHALWKSLWLENSFSWKMDTSLPLSRLCWYGLLGVDLPFPLK